MNRNTGMNAGQIIGTMNALQVVGLDIAKHVFQLHMVDMGTGEIVNMQIKRARVLEHFVNKAPCLIAIEACGGAHHWARELTTLGHTVRLLHAKVVRPFVSGNKTDATDARAIWLAVQQPGIKFVGIKTAAQQATLTLHRQRELMMKMRNMQTNAVRGLLYEFGATFAVEVAQAMVHGGPFPATSDSRGTSVGSRAIERFLRPVCYQDFPADLLPSSLADANSQGFWRVHDGQLSPAAVAS